MFPRGVMDGCAPQWVCAALTVLVVASLPARAARVYYVNQPENGLGVINAVKPDGTGHTTVYSTSSPSDIRGIALDAAGARLFYAHATVNVGTGARTDISIRSIPAAGGAPSTVLNLPTTASIADVEWDHVNGYVYFADTSASQLRRVKADGTEHATVFTHVRSNPGPYFFGLDLRGGYAYWGEFADSGTAFSRGVLATGTVDGSFVLPTPQRTRDIEIDHSVPGGRLYWTDRQGGAVLNRLVNGGSVLTSRSGLNAPHGLVIDVEAGKGYLADTGKRGAGTQPSAHRVVRFNLDGSGGLEFLSPADTVAEPWDLAVDLTTVSYADWRTRFFSASAQNANPNDDPDGDGRTNLVEYALFTHPERADAPLQLVQAQGKNFRFAKRRVSDVTCRVEVSTDLTTWRWNGDSTGTVWTQEVGATVRDFDSDWVTVGPAPALQAEPKLFYRLRPVP